MAKSKSFSINTKTLGILLFIALIIQYVLPQIKLGGFSWIGTAIVFVVGLILLFF